MGKFTETTILKQFERKIEREEKKSFKRRRRTYYSLKNLKYIYIIYHV